MDASLYRAVPNGSINAVPEVSVLPSEDYKLLGVTDVQQSDVADSPASVSEVESVGNSRVETTFSTGEAEHSMWASTPRAATGHDAWKDGYRRRVLVTDTVIVSLSVGIAQLIRFGPEDSGISYGFAFERASLLSVVLAVFWLLALALIRSRELELIGTGPDEYRRVIVATGWLFGGVGVVSLLLQAGIARGYLALALPIGLAGLLYGRRFWRRRLAKARSRGECTSDVIVIGSRTSVESIGKRFDKAKDAGYRVVGACVPGGGGSIDNVVDLGERDVPILGDENSIDAAISSTMADTFVVAAVEQLGYERMRDLTWKLEARKINLIVLPGMVDIVGQRLKIRPIDSFPLLHVAHARYDGLAHNGKWAFDFLLAALALVMFAPIIVLAAVAIKLEDGGPVYFRQERVGLRGQHFRIWKLRTMRVDADKEIATVKEAAGQSHAVFYKSAVDARVTRIGRFLRKTSIDEMPQLFNVLRGEMSIVGPRPLVPGEGSQVAHFIERRTLVKPGLTGLWQVSGRSGVSEDERIRLDHYYVDNWSAVQDLMIIWKTVAVVVKSDGAY